MMENFKAGLAGVGTVLLVISGLTIIIAGMIVMIFVLSKLADWLFK